MKKNILFVFLLCICFNGLAQWIQCNGPYGGDIRCLTQNTKTNTLFAGSFGGGIFRYKTTSDHWESLFAKLPQNLIYEIGILDSEIFVATYYGLFKSSDEGNNWDTAFTDDTSNVYPYNNIIENVFCANSILLLSEYSKIFISQDKGLSYNEIAQNIPDTASYIDDITMVGGRIFALYSTPKQNATIAYSDDFGLSWQKPTTNIPSPGFWHRFRFSAGKIYVFGYPSLCVSNDNGNTWINISPPGIPAGAEFTDIYISNDTILLATVYKGVFMSTDSGNSYKQASVGLPLQDVIVNQFYKTSLNQILLATILGIYNSADLGLTWHENYNNIIATTVPYIAQCDTLVFAGTKSQGLFATTDNGKNWLRKKNVLSNFNQYTAVRDITAIGNRLFLNGSQYSDDFGNTWYNWTSGPGAIHFDKSQGRIYAGTFSGIYYSSDSANTWNKLVNGPIHAAEPFRVKDNVIISEDSYHFNYPPYYSTFIRRSVDDGLSFSVVDTEHTFSDIEIIDSMVLAINESGNLVRSNDLGLTWTIDSIVGASGITDIYTIGTKYVFCGARNGKIYFSKDTSKTWMDVTSNFSGFVSKFFLIGNTLYVGTQSSGVWKSSILNFVDGYNNSFSQNNFRVYPNPNNGSFSVLIPSEFKNQNINLAIYNDIGERISEMPIQTNEVKISVNLAGKSKGLYFITLSYGSKRYNGKIVFE